MTLVFAPSESATRARAATYHGFDSGKGVVSRRLRAGSEVNLPVQAGQELEVINIDGGVTISLSITGPTGLSSELHVLGARDSPPGQSYGVKMPHAGSLRCRFDDPALGLEQGTGGTAEIRALSVSPGLGDATQHTQPLPEPLAKVLREIHVPASTAMAYQVKAGEYIQIIDVQGQQCSDFMAVRQDALANGQERYIDATVTRTLAGGAYPAPGLAEKYFDQDMRPLLAVVQDTVGRHDTFALACTARGYEERGFSGHANCSDNISEAYAPFGIAPKTAWPTINLFGDSLLCTDSRSHCARSYARESLARAKLATNKVSRSHEMR
jgi:Domain of unknown function (DUF1989)